MKGTFMVMQLVSAAFELPSQNQLSDDIRAVLGIVDKIHSDGALPKLHVVYNDDRYTYGQFHPSDPPLMQFSHHLYTMEPQELTATVVHETAHFLDWSGIRTTATVKGRNVPASENGSAGSGDMVSWFAATAQTQEITDLLDIMSVGSVDELRYAQYLLEPHEMWARCYTQWMAQKSNNAQLLASIATVRSRDGYFKSEQWDANSFEPIEREIDLMFHKLGWLS